MLSLRTDQRGLFESDHLWLDHVGRNSFYGFLANQRGELFKDEEFAELYSRDWGRPSVPPSLLATALLLQIHDRVSDEEARQRAAFDLRWKVALGLEVEERPFAKSTLQLFRAQLILHEKVRLPFERSLELARRRGFLKPERKLRLALDTTAVLGQGAIKDTFNLLADGNAKLIRELAQQEGQKPQRWAEKRGWSRYFGTSIKGEAELDWSDPEQRNQFLKGLVEDAERLLELARQARARVPEGSRPSVGSSPRASCSANCCCRTWSARRMARFRFGGAPVPNASPPFTTLRCVMVGKVRRFASTATSLPWQSTPKNN